MSGIIAQGKSQFFDGSGAPLAGGSVTFYIPGTTTFKNTYQDSALSVINADPVVLDANGMALIWGSGLYDMIVQDALGNQVWSAIGAAFMSSQDIQSGAMLFGLDTGTANTYIVNRQTQATTLTDGMQCWFRAANPNTGASTLTVDGLAQTPLLYQGSALPSGLITANGYYGCQYQAYTASWGLIYLANPSSSEWVHGPAPTYLSANTFTVVGNYTGTFQPNRRVTLTDNAAALYGTVQVSTYSSGNGTTSVQLLLDAGVLDVNLTSVAYGFLNAQNPSVPGLSLIPAGVGMAYGGTVLPVGWLWCDGTSYLRTAYPVLFAAIQTAFGAVDSLHFNVPLSAGRSPIGVGSAGQANTYTLGQQYGEELHTLAIGELATHTHGVNDAGHAHAMGYVQGGTSGGNNNGWFNSNSSSYAGTDAATTGITLADAGYSTGHNTVHPVLAWNWIIKT